MTTYPLYNEIIADIRQNPDRNPADILDEYISPLVDVCNEINEWCAGQDEPPWYQGFLYTLARFDVDLSPLWPQHYDKTREAIEQ